MKPTLLFPTFIAMNLEEEKIEAFWQWFVQNHERIKKCIEDDGAPDREYIIENLNNHILNLGTLTWDVGLDGNDDWFFMLSPNGVEELLPISERIIKEAPLFLDWKYYGSKPALDWDRNFNLYDQEMDVVEIDASNWSYILFYNTKDKLEIILEATNLNHIDEETLNTAATVFLNNEVGEKAIIELIERYSIVTELEAEDIKDKYPISELKAHIFSEE